MLVSQSSAILIVCLDDLYDRPYLVNNQTQFVAWAYGPRATEEGLRDLAFFHTEFPRGIPIIYVELCRGTIICQIMSKLILLKGWNVSRHCSAWKRKSAAGKAL